MDRANVKLHVGAQYGHFDEMFGIQHTEIRQKQVFFNENSGKHFCWRAVCCNAMLHTILNKRLHECLDCM